MSAQCLLAFPFLLFPFSFSWQLQGRAHEELGGGASSAFDRVGGATSCSPGRRNNSVSSQLAEGSASCCMKSVQVAHTQTHQKQSA